MITSDELRPMRVACRNMYSLTSCAGVALVNSNNAVLPVSFAALSVSFICCRRDLVKKFCGRSVALRAEVVCAIIVSLTASNSRLPNPARHTLGCPPIRCARRCAAGSTSPVGRTCLLKQDLCRPCVLSSWPPHPRLFPVDGARETPVPET